MKLPKSVSELCVIERIDVKKFTYVNEGSRASIDVIAKDGREYLVFDKKISATDHAINLCVMFTDDPDILEQLDMWGKPIEKYALAKVKQHGESYYLSYDQHNKIPLTGKAIAYRTI